MQEDTLGHAPSGENGAMNDQPITERPEHSPLERTGVAQQVPEPPPSLFGSSEEPTTAAAAKPASSGSSYRDIIAERMARQAQARSGSTPRPMAHSSDVENSPEKAAEPTPSPVPPVEMKTAEPSAIAPEIEQDTKAQEISSEAAADQTSQRASGEPLSSRERAMMRQRERAELRRGGQRRPATAAPSVPPMPEEGGEPTPDVPRETTTDVIAQRMSRGGERRERPERPEREPQARAERPERGERPERAERPERGERPERQPRGERPERQPREAGERPERAERPQRGDRPERAERPERVERPERSERPQREARPERPQGERPVQPERREPKKIELPKTEGKQPLADKMIESDRSSLRGGEPKTSERTSDTARSLASKLGISVVIPLYNEQDSLRELTAAVKQQCLRLAGPRYEIIYVNDGSTDRSGDILEDILATSSRVTVLSFRRNMGKSAGLAAGFAEAQYGIVITMDADLQDDPREFANLIAKLAEGYDLVSGWKKTRHDPMSKTGPSKLFNKVTSMFAGIKLHDFNCGLKAYRKEVTDSLQVYGELHRYLPALAYWQGFRVTEIPVTHHPRKFGKSKFGSSRFFKGFLDLLSIVFTNRYGKRPLHLFGTVGTLLVLAGLFIDVWVSVEWIMGLTALSNRPILLLGILLILVGVQLISLGLLGEMIVKNTARFVPVSQKKKGKPSAEARERRASRMARIPRGPRPSSRDRRPRT